MRDIPALRNRFIEWVSDRAEDSTSVAVPCQEFLHENGLSTGEGLSLARDCAAAGLVTNHSGMAAVTVSLTGHGLESVRSLRMRRADPALRSVASRNALLRWLYEQYLQGMRYPPISNILLTDYANFEGDRLTADEFNRAAEYLKQKGLIKGTSSASSRAPVRPQITDMGQDCIEHYGGDVREFLRSQAQTGPSITNNIGTVHNSGAMAIGSTDVTQHVTGNIDPAAMAAFVQVLLKELPQLQLPDEDKARSELQAVQSETTKPNPDRGRITAALGRFAGYLSDAGRPVVTALLVLVAQHFGMPER